MIVEGQGYTPVLCRYTMSDSSDTTGPTTRPLENKTPKREIGKSRLPFRDRSPPPVRDRISDSNDRTRLPPQPPESEGAKAELSVICHEVGMTISGFLR